MARTELRMVETWVWTRGHWLTSLERLEVRRRPDGDYDVRDKGGVGDGRVCPRSFAEAEICVDPACEWGREEEADLG